MFTACRKKNLSHSAEASALWTSQGDETTVVNRGQLTWLAAVSIFLVLILFLKENHCNETWIKQFSVLSPPSNSLFWILCLQTTSRALCAMITCCVLHQSSTKSDSKYRNTFSMTAFLANERSFQLFYHRVNKIIINTEWHAAQPLNFGWLMFRWCECQVWNPNSEA